MLRAERQAQRETAREEAERQREEAERQREEAERQRKEAERQRDFELRIATLRQDSIITGNSIGKSPKLPPFACGKDDLHSYLQRFERFAQSNNWNVENWAVSLSALLTGKALDVYSRLSDEDANNYELLKRALLKRYELTEDGYYKKFKNCKPEEGESPQQFTLELKPTAKDG